MDTYYTYFAVIYDDNNFDLEGFKSKLNLKNIKIEEYGRRVKGNENKFKITIGYCNNFNVDVNVMLRCSIRDLVGKEEILLDLKNKYSLEYYLERVIYLDDGIRPILSLDNDIVEFLFKTKTIDDLDYYI